MLNAGIVGLPNVGKSALFNAISSANVGSENFPFCTIDPNIGSVSVPDNRLQHLSDLFCSERIIPATIDFVDIAGLVKGASKGEGLGNQFLSHVRSASVLVHVVRCFEDDQVVHVHGNIDPLHDVDVIETELLLSDLEMVERLLERQAKKSKSGDAQDKERYALLERLRASLQSSTPIRSMSFDDQEQEFLNEWSFLTAKKMIYVANIADHQLGQPVEMVTVLTDYAKQRGGSVIDLCVKLEEEISQLDLEDRAVFMKEMGLSYSGLDRLAKATFSLLGLQTFLTAGPKEVHAWPIPVGA